LPPGRPRPHPARVRRGALRGPHRPHPRRGTPPCPHRHHRPAGRAGQGGGARSRPADRSPPGPPALPGPAPRWQQRAGRPRPPPPPPPPGPRSPRRRRGGRPGRAGPAGPNGRRRPRWPPTLGPRAPSCARPRSSSRTPGPRGAAMRSATGQARAPRQLPRPQLQLPRLRAVAPISRVPRLPFLLLTIGAIVAGVFGLVALNVSVNQQSFQISELQRQNRQAEARWTALQVDVDRLKAPARIAKAAKSAKLAPPGRRPPGARPPRAGRGWPPGRTRGAELGPPGERAPPPPLPGSASPEATT